VLRMQPCSYLPVDACNEACVFDIPPASAIL
jgi:hypothetical protein